MQEEPRGWLARHLRVMLAVGAVVAVLLAGAVGWVISAARSADRVSAAWTPTCTGTTVASYEGDPEIRSRPGFRCDIALKIINAGDHSIRLARVETPLLGTGGRAEVRGYSTPDAEIRDANAQEDGTLSRFGAVHAVYDLDLTIPAHASRTVDLRIGWRHKGCNSDGRLSVDGWPSVVFDSLHRTFRYTPDQMLLLRTYDDAHDHVACPD